MGWCIAEYIQMDPANPIGGVIPPFILGGSMGVVAFKFSKPSAGMLNFFFETISFQKIIHYTHLFCLFIVLVLQINHLLSFIIAI